MSAEVLHEMNGLLAEQVDAFAAVLEQRDLARDVAVQLEQQVAAVLALHRPIEGGMGNELDNGRSYGHMSCVCTACGTPDEYGVKWPCATVRAVGVGATGETDR